jgi:tetratricopeptide (TPR) repeat protein
MDVSFSAKQPMYRSALLLSTAIWGVHTALIQDRVPATQSMTKVAIGRVAKGITLRLESTSVDRKGSGVLIEKQGDVYTVLTAAHVVNQSSTIRLVAPDGQVYQSSSIRKANSNLDLAVVKFRSSQNYPIATIGTSNGIESGVEIYVAGFPAATSTIDDGVFQFTSGNVTGNAAKPNASGYSLIYNCITLPGMSGGPVLNDQGKLVAIHGQGDRGPDGQKTGFNLGITIERFGTVAATLGASPQKIAQPPTTTNAPQATDFFLSGYEKANKGDYSGAMSDYDRAIALNPNYAQAYNNRGYIKVDQLNDPQGALADYNRALELDSQFALAFNNRGLLKIEKLNDIQGALADYNKAIALDPKFAWPVSNRGLLKVDKLNDISGALADYNKAIALDPQMAIAYNNRGWLKIDKLNDIPGGLADYNKAIALEPKYALSYNNRGYLKIEKFNDVPGALADYNRALQLNPKLALAYNNRGHLKLNRLNDIQGALADYNQAIAYNPQDHLAYLNLGFIKYEKLNDPQGALANYNQSIAANPSYALAYINRGLVKANSLKDIPGALADYNRAIELDPKNALTYNNRGFLKIDKLNDPAGALADYDRAIQLDPKFALAYHNRGYFKKNHSQDRAGAIQDFRQAARFYRQEGMQERLRDVLNQLRFLGANE